MTWCQETLPMWLLFFEVHTLVLSNWHDEMMGQATYCDLTAPISRSKRWFIASSKKIWIAAEKTIPRSDRIWSLYPKCMHKNCRFILMCTWFFPLHTEVDLDRFEFISTAFYFAYEQIGMDGKLERSDSPTNTHNPQGATSSEMA